MLQSCRKFCFVFRVDDLLKSHSKKLSDENKRRTSVLSHLEQLIMKCNKCVDGYSGSVSIGISVDDVTAAIIEVQVNQVWMELI